MVIWMQAAFAYIQSNPFGTNVLHGFVGVRVNSVVAELNRTGRMQIGIFKRETFTGICRTKQRRARLKFTVKPDFSTI